MYSFLCYGRRICTMCKRGQREETILLGRSWCCFRSSYLFQIAGRATADLFLLQHQSHPYCLLTDPGAPHQDYGTIWRYGKNPSCSLLPFKILLDTACQSILLHICSEKEVQGLLPEEDLCSHIDIGELELHKFAIICKEGLRPQAR